MRNWIPTGLVAALLLAPTALPAGGEIHGTVTTTDGDRLTGPIRWDRNENFWDDILDARQERDETDDGFSLSIFGWKVSNLWRSRDYRTLTIPFGHIETLEPLWDGGATITLKNGMTLEVAESSDLGRNTRGVVVRDGARGEVELDWDGIERIEFSAGPGPGLDAERLYGDVVTAAGTFRGFIVWDRDESLREDVLDGDENGRRHRVRFAEIREIERRGRDSSRVRLADGNELMLRGTNDVNSGNRGIDVTVTGLGRLQVGWRDFERVTFLDPPASRRYEAFDGSRPLHGTVSDGRREITGRIRWDRDEEHDFEMLDGEIGGIEYGIAFENIRAIRPLGSDRAEVELTDGSKLVLGGSNDVDYRNRGVIVITAEGVEHDFYWDDIRSVTFEGK